MKASMLLERFRTTTVVLIVTVLSLSCAERNLPAPVKELYQGRTFKDFSPRSFAGINYQVQKGDTLFSIAWYSGNDYRDLAQLNGIKKPYKIYPGQNVTLKKAVNKASTATPKQTGLTTKTITNQGVDPTKKQGYGEGGQKITSHKNREMSRTFPVHINNWTWPTTKAVFRGFSVKEEGNKGLDFLGTMGEPVRAAADGKVVYTGNALRGFGQLVIIKHSEAYLTAYAHNDEVLVNEQQWVKLGQKIANMGSSGTDKVMLHFEVRYKGRSVNPIRYLPKR
jgi:lipoprotein NlpD